MISSYGLCSPREFLEAQGSCDSCRKAEESKGKATFNLNFQLFSESRWEDGDIFCSLDPHENAECQVPELRGASSTSAFRGERTVGYAAM